MSSGSRPGNTRDAPSRSTRRKDSSWPALRNSSSATASTTTFFLSGACDRYISRMTTGNSVPNIGTAYDVEGEIGRGAMATVYRAYDRRHSRRVAVKVLDREIAASI